MTVKDLRERLAKLPPEMDEWPVYCTDYSGENSGEITEANELLVEPAEFCWPDMVRIRA